MSKHTLSVLVENKHGVLARVAALVARRGFNIDSLAVGPTEHPDVSRMTIVVNVEPSELPAIDSVWVRVPQAVEGGSLSTILPTSVGAPRSTCSHCGNALLALSQ